MEDMANVEYNMAYMEGMDTGVDAAPDVPADPPGVYTHRFGKPFTYMGKAYGSLRFDWGRLTGADALEIERELNALGAVLILPAYNGPYLCRLAAKACDERVGADAFEGMPMRDFMRIQDEARGFLQA